MRLEITRRSDLATRALLELAQLDRQVKAAELAERIGTTKGFLSQAMTPLAAKGWIRSEPGPTGGYRLLVPVDQINVLQVVEALEGPTDDGSCVLQDRPCSGGGHCALHTAWAGARTQLVRQMEGTTLATLLPTGSA